jgi:uncharacterized protein YndB with AHSA1/START domain
MSGQTVTMRRVLPASCEEVFDAWLDAEGMRQWMQPGPVTSCEVMLEPCVGGQFRIVMAAPGTEIVNTGEFRVLERPSKLQFTWISTRWGGEETLITIELHPRERHCELVLIHERFPEQYSAPGLEQGWGQMLEKLGGFLAPQGSE